MIRLQYVRKSFTSIKQHTNRSSSSPSSSSVLVRYVKADGKIHTVNLQNANLADGRTHSILVRLGGLQRSSMQAELYVDCRLADSSQGLPPLVPLPREADMVEIRHGQKSYARLQVQHKLTHRLRRHAFTKMRHMNRFQFVKNLFSLKDSNSVFFFGKETLDRLGTTQMFNLQQA